jgi:hypothetical protein
MRRAGRLSLALFLVLAALSAPRDAAAAPTRLTKGPYVTGFSDTTADVRFELDAAGPATLEIGAERSTAAVRKIGDPVASAMHVVHVTGLEAGKTYGYGITLGGPVVARGMVTTAPKPDAGTPVHFLVYGDSRSDPTAHGALTRLMVETPSDFLLNTGDIVEDGGNAADWQSFFQIEAPLLRERPLLLCIGNHELYDDEAGASFARYFGFLDAAGVPRPYGTTRVGMVRFFFLNAMHGWDAGEERDWFDRELRKADAEAGLVWRVAVIHHGLWSSGPHGPNPRLVAGHVADLLASHKIDLVLSGHDHIYERGDAGSMKYLISGGGGAPLYKIGPLPPTTRKAESAYHFIEVTASASDVRILARRLDGSVLDRCAFAKGAGWDCDTAPPPAPPPPPLPIAPPPAAPPPPPPSSSRCAVTAPGREAAPPSWLAVALAAGAIAASRKRRRG